VKPQVHHVVTLAARARIPAGFYRIDALESRQRLGERVALLSTERSAKARADAGAAGVRRNLMRLRRRAPTIASGKSVDT
jgi:hypothetical protein